MTDINKTVNYMAQQMISKEACTVATSLYQFLKHTGKTVDYFATDCRKVSLRPAEIGYILEEKIDGEYKPIIKVLYSQDGEKVTLNIYELWKERYGVKL